MSKLISVYFKNPLKTWWKARKYFKCPKPKISFFCHKQRVAKLLDINVHDVFWKDKWDSPSYEVSPIIYLCLFNRIGFIISFQITGIDEFGEKINCDMPYWEYLLDYLYYSKSLKMTSWWTYTSRVATVLAEVGNEEDDGDDVIKPLTLPIMTHLFSLNKRGLKEFKKLYERRQYSIE